MTMKKTLLSSSLALPLLLSGVANAATLTFTQFDVSGTNTAQLSVDGGVAIGVGDPTLSIARSGSTALRTFAVTYTGSDFDGDSNNDTLTFDLTADAFSGGIVSNGGLGASSATIGTTDAAFNIASGPARGFSDGNGISNGTSIVLTVQNLNLILTGGGSQAAVFTGFTGVSLEEDDSPSDGGTSATVLGHDVVIGSGTGLDGYTFDEDLNLDFAAMAGPLYVTGAGDGTDFDNQFGVGDWDLVVTVVPEPSVALLGGLGILGLLRRRRDA